MCILRRLYVSAGGEQRASLAGQEMGLLVRIPGRGLVQGSACARGCVCCTHTTCPWAAASCARSAPLARAVRRGCARRRPGWEGGGGSGGSGVSPRAPAGSVRAPPPRRRRAQPQTRAAAGSSHAAGDYGGARAARARLFSPPRPASLPLPPLRPPAPAARRAARSAASRLRGVGGRCLRRGFSTPSPLRAGGGGDVEPRM